MLKKSNKMAMKRESNKTPKLCVGDPHFFPINYIRSKNFE